MSINGFSDRALAKKQYNDNSDAAKPSNNPIPANTPGLFLHATRSSVKKNLERLALYLTDSLAICTELL